MNMQVNRAETRRGQVDSTLATLQESSASHGAQIKALWSAVFTIAAESDFDVAKAVRDAFEDVNLDTLA